jgi:hypothetical protein
MESLADFGSVMANSQVISKEVELTNQGSAPGIMLLPLPLNPLL